MRVIPEPLRTTLEELLERLASDPYARAADSGRTAFEELRALSEALDGAGRPDPFVTELLADHTRDHAQAIGLYERAIEQCRTCPGEPVHTKRLEIGRRRLELDDRSGARAAFRQALSEAAAAEDLGKVEELRFWLAACDELPGREP